jgi:hypothetical protein
MSRRAASARIEADQQRGSLRSFVGLKSKVAIAPAAPRRIRLRVWGSSLWRDRDRRISIARTATRFMKSSRSNPDLRQPPIGRSPAAFAVGRCRPVTAPTSLNISSCGRRHGPTRVHDGDHSGHAPKRPDQCFVRHKQRRSAAKLQALLRRQARPAHSGQSTHVRRGAADCVCGCLSALRAHNLRLISW